MQNLPPPKWNERRLLEDISTFLCRILFLRSLNCPALKNMPNCPIYTSNNVKKFHKRIYFLNFTNTPKHEHCDRSSKIFLSVVFWKRGLEVMPIQFNSISACSSIKIFEMERMINCQMLIVSLIRQLIRPSTI